MKKKVIIILILNITITSCTHLMPQYLNETPNEFYSRINYLCEGKLVEINLVNEKKYFGNNLIINSKCIKFFDTVLKKYQEVDVKDVVSISFKEQGRGLYEGFLYGAMLGGVLGLSTQILPITSIAHPKGDLNLIYCTSLAGAVIGSIYGFFNKSKTTIKIGNFYENN